MAGSTGTIAEASASNVVQPSAGSTASVAVFAGAISRNTAVCDILIGLTHFCTALCDLLRFHAVSVKGLEVVRDASPIADAGRISTQWIERPCVNWSWNWGGIGT